MYIYIHQIHIHMHRLIIGCYPYVYVVNVVCIYINVTYIYICTCNMYYIHQQLYSTHGPPAAGHWETGRHHHRDPGEVGRPRPIHRRSSQAERGGFTIQKLGFP